MGGWKDEMDCWDGVDGMGSCDVRRVRVIGWGGRRIGFMCSYIYILLLDSM
jgi:hypothetical protein